MAGLLTAPSAATEGLPLSALETCGRIKWLGRETGHNPRFASEPANGARSANQSPQALKERGIE